MTAIHFMPFGKHKGENVDDLPIDYLVWLRDEAKVDNPLLGWVCDAITSAEKRSAVVPVATAPALPAHLEEYAELIILEGFKSVKLTTKDLKRLQQAREWLEKAAGLA